MKVTLILDIEYDVSRADEADALATVQDVLHASINRMVGNGGLSGDTPFEVDSWDVHTELTEG